MKRLIVLFLLALISVTVSASQLHRSRTDSRLLETVPHDTQESGDTESDEYGTSADEPANYEEPEISAPLTGGEELVPESETTPETDTTPESETVPEYDATPEEIPAPLSAQTPPDAAIEYEMPLNPFAPPSGETIVTSFSELKTALENDNGITTVFLGADITMTGGIRVNPNKQSVVISGQNPEDTERPYTLTDLSSLSFYSTIYVDAAGTSSITVRDLNITGKNYYGPVGIYDMAALSGLELIFERVNYNGPQLGYHRRGMIRIKDCTAVIHGGNGGSPMQEFAESKHLIFEGTNTINTETNLQPVFRHPTGGILQIDDDSVLTLTSTNTSSSYGVLSTDLPIYDLDILIGERAQFHAEITGVMSTDAFTILSGMTISEGGLFNLKTTKAASAAVLRIVGALTVLKEAQFIIDGYGGASYPALKVEGEISAGADAVFQIKAQSAYSALIDLIGGAFVCNDPASVLLYSAGRTIMAESAAGRVYVNAEQINYWNAVTPGGLDNQPMYRWSKPDGTGFELDGTLLAGSGGNFTAITSSYTPGDPPGTPPDPGTFSMINARVLAFGHLPLSVIKPNVKHAVISGATNPGAVLRASFTQEGVNYVTDDVIADASGIFHIPANVPLSAGTQIVVMSNWNYLTAEKTAVVTAEGKLEFDVPELLEFYITEISAQEKRIKRLHHGWGIIVSDERESGEFTLIARLESELTPDKAGLPELEGAVIYVGADGTQTVLRPGEDFIIAAKAGLTGEDGMYPVIWEEDKGILVLIKPGAAYAGTMYTAQISWQLIDGP